MSYRNLPFHVLPVAFGVMTNFDEATLAGKYLSQGQNIDGYDTFRTASRLKGSLQITTSLGGPVKSLHQFEFTDFDLQRKRRQLAFANLVLNTVTYLDAGAVAGVPLTLPAGASWVVSERLRASTMNDRLHLSGKNQRGLPTGGVKYDGTRLTHWGVLAPGTARTTFENLNSQADWTASADVVKSNNAILTQDGAGGVQVDKAGTTLAEIFIERAGLAHNLSAVGTTAGIFFFVPSGALQKLNTPDFRVTGVAADYAVAITIGNTGLGNANKYKFTVGQLLTGWNLLSIGALATPDETIGAGATLTNIQQIRLAIKFTGAAQTQSGFAWDWFFVNPLGACTAAGGGAGNVSGSVRYRITFVSEYGLESNAGPASNSLITSVAASGTLTIALVPVAAETVTIDNQVYTWRATVTTTANEVLIGANIAECCANLAAAINAGAGAGVKYGSLTAAHFSVTAAATATTVVVTARVAGTAGNSIATTETMAGAGNQWGAATLAGGVATQTVSLTVIPVSSDTQVLARRIYRDLDGDAIFRFVGEIRDNVTTTFSDNVAFAGLGGEPPIAGDDALDHSPPGRLLDVIAVGNRLYGISAESPNTIVPSNVNQPEAFSILDQIVIDDDVVAIRDHVTGILIYTPDRTYRLTGIGTAADPFAVQLVNYQNGANGTDSALRIKGYNLTVHEFEVHYTTGDPTDTWVVNSGVQNLFRQVAGAALDDMFLVHDRSRYRVVFFGQTVSGGSYDTIIVFQYGSLGFQQITGQGAGTDPQDLRTGVWWTMSLPTAYNPQCAEVMERTADQPELWIGGNDGFVYWLQAPGALLGWQVGPGASLVTTPGTILETQSVPMGAGPGGRGEPRYLQLNLDHLGAMITLDFVVEVLTGPGANQVLGFSSFSYTTAPGATLSAPIIAIPSIGARGEWARVRVTNNGFGAFGALRDLILYYIPRADMRGPKAR